MNPAQLLAHFDRISEAPNAIPRLRCFILDLAVRGKLVAQDPNDEPASELLKRIQAEKARLVKEGILRRQQLERFIDDAQLPFRAPVGWCWVRLAIISRRIHYGFTASANKSLKEVRLLRITDIQNNSVNWALVPGCEISQRETDQYKLERGDILIARTGGTIGKTFLVGHTPVTAVFASYLIRVQPSLELYDKYLKLFLESPIYWEQLQDGARGGGQPNVNGQMLGSMAVTLPPLAEQHRIVAKVDDLMVLCDRLEAAQAERESQRDRLTAASLHRLNQPVDAPALRDHARFHLQHLPLLTTRPEHIQQLRRTIFNLAVRGRLVPQDPNDEPASELLKRIQTEKARLIKEGILQKEKPLAPIDGHQVPFPIPTSWSWTKIGTCSSLIEYGTSVRSEAAEMGVPVIRMGDIQEGRVLLGGQKKVPRQIEELPQLYLKRFDLLYNRTNSADLVGKTGIYLGEDDTYTFASYLIRIQFLRDLMSPIYSNLAMNAPYFRDTQILPELQQQCGQANVNGTKLRNMAIPLPPLTEQRCITAKVDELMGLCDRLEAQLTATRTESSRLLEAILHQALAPAS
jgi:type I restriction enzyme, S subunit